jgi:hypothetical protein
MQPRETMWYASLTEGIAAVVLMLERRSRPAHTARNAQGINAGRGGAVLPGGLRINTGTAPPGDQHRYRAAVGQKIYWSFAVAGIRFGLCAHDYDASSRRFVL